MSDIQIEFVNNTIEIETPHQIVEFEVPRFVHIDTSYWPQWPTWPAWPTWPTWPQWPQWIQGIQWATWPQWPQWIPWNINSLNGLSWATQTFDVGSTGTDFNIVSSGTTHTFNLPTASALARGALSSTDWTTFNNKQDKWAFDIQPDSRDPSLDNEYPWWGTALRGQARRATVADTAGSEYFEYLDLAVALVDNAWVFDDADWTRVKYSGANLSNYVPAYSTATASNQIAVSDGSGSRSIHFTPVTISSNNISWVWTYSWQKFALTIDEAYPVWNTFYYNSFIQNWFTWSSATTADMSNTFTGIYRKGTGTQTKNAWWYGLSGNMIFLRHQNSWKIDWAQALAPTVLINNGRLWGDVACVTAYMSNRWTLDDAAYYRGKHNAYIWPEWTFTKLYWLHFRVWDLSWAAVIKWYWVVIEDEAYSYFGWEVWYKSSTSAITGTSATIWAIGTRTIELTSATLVSIAWITLSSEIDSSHTLYNHTWNDVMILNDLWTVANQWILTWLWKVYVLRNNASVDVIYDRSQSRWLLINTAPQSIILSDMVDSSALTWTNANTLMKSGLIKAWRISVGDMLNLFVKASKTWINATFSIRVYVNTIANISWATLLATSTSSSNGTISLPLGRDIAIKSASNTFTFPVSTSATTDLNSSTVTYTASNIDRNIDQYMIIALQNASIADSTIVNYFTLYTR